MSIPGQMNQILGLRAPSCTYALVLSAGVAQELVFPTGTKWVLFCGTADFYVDWHGVAAVPSETITTGYAAELNPSLRDVGRTGSYGGASRASVVSPANSVVTASFWS